MTAHVGAPAAMETGARHAATRIRRRPRRTGRRWLRVALVLVVLLIAAVAWVVYVGMQAKGNLLRAADDVAVLQHQAESGDLPGERISLANLQREAHSARVETG